MKTALLHLGNVIIFIIVFVSDTVSASSWDKATLLNPPDSTYSDSNNPPIKIAQRIDSSLNPEKMTTVLTSDNNQVISNANGSIPTYVGLSPYCSCIQGVSFVIPSFVDGKAVTGLQQGITDRFFRNTRTFSIAAFENINGNVEAAPLGNWLMRNWENATVPDLFAYPTRLYTDIFYGVDLAVLLKTPLDLNYLNYYQVSNGVSPELPGFTFSLKPLSIGPSGWSSNSLFSGVVHLHTYHNYTVPEPSSWALFTTVLFVLCAIRLRKSNRSHITYDMTY